MQKTNPDGVGGRHRVSFVVLGVALVAYFGSLWYAGYAESKRYESELPQLALQTLMGDLRRFHGKAGRFPKDLTELRAQVASKRPGPALDEDGCSFTAGNYFYRYSFVAGHAATVWAVPLGPRRTEASTNFLVVSSADYALWRGPALDAEQCRSLRSDPSAVELGALGLTKQTPPPVRQPPPGTSSARR